MLAIALLFALSLEGLSPPAAPTPAPTNRVEIGEAVRKNLGITFATAERRNVSQTMRVPGRFELLPTATRQHRAPVKGQVELLVGQFQQVQAGTPLYRIDSAEWSELQARIAGLQARLAAMAPQRQAHTAHEESIEERVQLWKSRLLQLEALREAGGGSQAHFAEARAQLSSAQADLAEAREKEADLHAQRVALEAELAGVTARYELILKAVGGATGSDSGGKRSLEIRAVDPGVVDVIGAVNGSLVDEGALVLSVVRPDQVRFRAKAMQSDLGKLSDGLPVQIVPPVGTSLASQQGVPGTLAIGLTADPDERTIDLLVRPEALPTWARAGVSAQLEIALAGGTHELAIPLAAVVRDGATPLIFRRNPGNPDQAIRLAADLGVSDGRWVVVESGLKEGDQVVLDGNYQLMLATAGSAPKGGHFHSDGTFHEGKD